MSPLNIFSASCTQELALRVIDKINLDNSHIRDFSEKKISLGNANLESFKDGEITCDFENSIRKKEVYIFGGTGTNQMMELCILLDAAKRASPSEIHVVLPYYGYARQDKKEGKHKRGPIGAKLVADLISVAAGNKLGGITTIDLHAEAIEGFFDVPVNHIGGITIFKPAIEKLLEELEHGIIFKTIIASPDAGGKVRAKRTAKRMNLELVGMDKNRVKPGEIAGTSLVGEVENMNIIIIDDLIDSGGTLLASAEYLIKEKKALSVHAVCTHPLLTGKAVDKIKSSEFLSTIIVSDTIKLSDETKNCDKIKIQSSADILAKILGRVHVGGSMYEING